MASLFVIQGADQGKRFEFMSGPVGLGRDSSNTDPAPRHRGFPPPCRAEARAGRVIGLSTWARPTGRTSTASPSMRPCCTRAIGCSSGRPSCCFTRRHGGAAAT